MQGINTAILQLGDKVSVAINESSLPPVCVKLVLENMLNQVIPQCNNAIMQEQQQADQKAGEENVVHESELE